MKETERKVKKYTQIHMSSFAENNWKRNNLGFRAISYNGGFPCGSDNKDLPTVEDTQIQSLNQEDPLEKGMATHSSILA